MNRKYDYEKIKSLYLSGASLNQIAEIIGCGDELARKALISMGVPRRPKGASSGEGNHQFKGGIRQRKDGYQISRGSRAKPLQHRLIAEKALGRKLENGMVVHHINCNPADNRPGNLLICDQAYHMALHKRMKDHPYWSQFSNPQKKYKSTTKKEK